MKFVIDQSAFASALALAATVTDRRGSMPVLANVLLRAEGSDEDASLWCCATDTMIAVRERVPARVIKAGGLTLGARHLLGVVKAIPAGEIELIRLDNHWAQVLGKRSEFRLMGLPESDFPELPDPEGVTFHPISARGLATMVQRTLFSVSNDEARVNLNGALFECDGTHATMVSTDGHRLTKFRSGLRGPKLEQGIIIPRKGLQELRRVLDRFEEQCEIGIANEQLFVRDAQVCLSIKLSSVSFPPYEQVIPSAYTKRASAPRDELRRALEAVKVMAPEKTATVRLELEAGNLRLTADNPDAGVAQQELPVDYEGETLVAGFNATYLLEALDAMDAESISLEFQGELDPCVLRPVDGPEFLAVVMPMRI